MAQFQSAIFVCCLVLALAFASTSAHKHVNIAVEGMVYCQACRYNRTQSLTDAEAIPNAKVNVTCIDHDGKMSFDNTFETDADGYFYALLEGFKTGDSLLDHPLHSCSVKLVSSSFLDCNVVTDVNYGVDGAQLRYENKRIWTKDYAAVIYSAGPLAFRPAYCAANPTP